MQRPRLLIEQLICGDYLDVAALMEPDSVDLVFGSPPYEDARTYGIDFKLKGQDWVDWMVQVVRESARISKGLVAFVVQGRTRKFKWSCTPALLIADLHRAGFNVRRPVIFQRYGTPGSGGPDWFRCNHEYVICVTKPGKLFWSNNTACGHPPKYGQGGPMSNRKKDGNRVNQWGGNIKSGSYRKTNGTMAKAGRPSHQFGKPCKNAPIANPGDVINCGAMGRGNMGSELCHENEAPFPEKLAEFFIKSFCPPGGVVLDPFGGSATTASVAKQNGRGYINIDIRQSQIELAQRRLEE